MSNTEESFRDDTKESFRDSLIGRYITAVQKNLTVSDLLQVASIEHLQAIDNIHRQNVTEESKYIFEIDDVPLTDGDRILIKDQNDSSQNGIYTYTTLNNSSKLEKLDIQISSGWAYIIQKGKVNFLSTYIPHIDPNHPENVHFQPFSIDTPSNSGDSVTTQHTLSGLDGRPLTIFNSDLAITKDVYVPGKAQFGKVGVTDSLSLYNPSVKYNISLKDDLFDITVGENSALSINKDGTVSMSKDLQCIGKTFLLNDTEIHGNLFISGNFSISQGSFLPTSIHINSDTSFISAVDLDNFGQMTLSGANASINGPHITTFSYADSTPLLNISSWTHDDISINMDCFYDGISCFPSHDTASQIRKHRNQLQFNYFDSTVNGFLTALSIDLKNGNVLFSTPNTVFSNTDGATGSIKILPSLEKGESSIAFYKSPILKTGIPNEFWKISMDNKDDTLNIMLGNENPALVFSNTGEVSVESTANNAFTVNGGLISKGTIAGHESLKIFGKIQGGTLFIESDTNISNNGSAAAIITGGMQVGKSLVVNDQIVSTRLLLSAKNSRIIFNGADYGAPLLNANSPGSRIVLSKSLSPVTTNAAIGTESNGSVWQSIPAPLESYSHIWYAGATQLMKLDGIGNLNVLGRGNTVSFSGLSANSGLYLQGQNTDTPVFLRYSDNWSLGQHETGDFILEKSELNGIKVRIFSVSKTDHSLRISHSLHTIGAINSSSSVSSSYITVAEGKVRLTRTGLTYLQHNILTFPSSTSDLSFRTNDDTPVDINGEKMIPISSTTTRNSVTNINQNNNGKIVIWNGVNKIITFSENGSYFKQGGVQLKSGSIDVLSGDINIQNGNVSSKTISTGKCTIKNNFDPTLSLQTDSTNINISVDNGTSVITSNSDISIFSKGKLSLSGTTSVLVSSPTIQCNNAVVVGSFTHVSDYLGSYSSVEGRVRQNSHYETFVNEKDNAIWLYIGRLNTTVSANGSDECGYIHLGITDVKSGFQTQLTAYLQKGTAQVYHNFVNESSANTSMSTIQLFRNDNKSDEHFGDIHIYIKVTHNTILVLDILKYISGAKLTIRQEGHENLPNGAYSGFNSSWSRIYTSKSSSSYKISYGEIQTKSLDVQENCTVGKDLVVHGNMYVNRPVYLNENLICSDISSKSHSLSLRANDSLLMSLGRSGITVSSSIIPQAEQLIDIGSRDYPFSAGYYKTLHAQSAHFKNGLLCNKIETSSVTVSENIVSEHTTTTTLDVLGVTNVQDLTISGHITGSYNLSISGMSELDNLVVRNGLQMSGSLAIDDVTVKTLGSKLIADTSKLVLQHGDNKVSLDQNGELSSLSHIILSPNEDPLMVLTQSGDVIIHQEDLTKRSSSQLLVNSDRSVFKNSTYFSKDIFVHADCNLDGRINIRNNTRLYVENDILYFQNHSGSVSLNKEGDLLLSDGGITCSRDSFFTTIRTSYLYNSHTVLSKADGSEHSSIQVNVKDNSLCFQVKDNNGFIHFLSNRNAEKSFVFSGAPNSICYFDTTIKCSNSLYIGGSEDSKGLTIYGNTQGNNAGITLHNDTTNSATLSLASFNGKGALLVENSGGDVHIRAAGKRGMSVSAISGNVLFDGTVAISSALDMESTDIFDKSSAAIYVKGGARIGANLLVNKKLILESGAGENRVSLSAPTDMTDNYTLVLPRYLPESNNCVLSCDAQGNMYWKTLIGEVDVVEDVDVVKDIDAVDVDTENPDTNSTNMKRITIGGTVVSDSVFGQETALLSLQECTFVNNRPLSDMDTYPEWSAVYISSPLLDMSNVMGNDESVNEFSASTITIKGAPQSKFTKDLYAINVQSGNVIIKETHDAVAVNDAALVVSGGLAVGKAIRCGSEIFTESLSIDGGTRLGKMVVGKQTIGASDEKSRTINIDFSQEMPDVDYVINGNVVSAKDDDAVYICSFKRLKTTGCSATVCRIDGSAWDDITVTIHYTLTSYLSS